MHPQICEQHGFSLMMMAAGREVVLLQGCTRHGASACSHVL